MERRLIRQNGNGLYLNHGRKRTRPIALRRTLWCVLQGLERDGQRTRAGILADVSDSRRDNVEPFQHRRIRLLDCFARYGESSFILRRLDHRRKRIEQGVKLTRHSRLITSVGARILLDVPSRVRTRDFENIRECFEPTCVNIFIVDSIFFLCAVGRNVI